ncbi:MAG: hypothetical protein K2H86_07470 [Muribaculaceae bacterium]|nr:hypothetical protein [Muribaculaceae bacterium]
MPKIKKSVWLPVCLLIYTGIMTLLFARDWIDNGHALRFFLILFAELVIILLLTIFLRKRERME